MNESNTLAQAQCPKAAVMAGKIWMGTGIVYLLYTLAYAVMNNAGGGGLLIGAVIAGLIAAVFIQQGKQTISGAAKDTFSNGLGSILIGGLCVWAASMNLGVGAKRNFTPDYVGAAANVIAALALIGAGVLAMTCRQEYQKWKESLSNTKPDA